MLGALIRRRGRLLAAIAAVLVVLVGDALFHALWQRSGQSADDMWPRHANLE